MRHRKRWNLRSSFCLSLILLTITIWKGEEKFSAASLLDVLTTDLNCGARVVLEAIGPDEHEALNKLELLLLSFPDEERALS
jgi:phosphotransferase system HPr-like phosphotransfer protein